MDALDQQLLALLRANARLPTATLARKLGVSRGTVANRLARLEDSGVIVGYALQLRPDARPDEIRAWMSIAIEGNQTRQVLAILLGEPGVSALHDTNGRWDLLAELVAPNLAELARVMERIRLIKGISATETSIHLQSYKLT
ncbi:Lrp/AsnC family transcriptional regulator [Crenobacter caeni]|uniref:Lrp/AsnC family transcriptional regulator n=1 Tax=Crenobacter caeni TaxID=2705474 RepID=A0A6B2KMN3_9NEIS|nr:Lrp/AsnC family transcriptional regulator [Crenobacter caeni]NDV11408.1 Lrp/AsnC family transcriptional regulator [Crenobacter caeni]